MEESEDSLSVRTMARTLWLARKPGFTKGISRVPAVPASQLFTSGREHVTADRRAHESTLETPRNVYNLEYHFLKMCYFAFELSVCFSARSGGLTLLAVIDVMLSYPLASRPGLDHQARASRGRI
jgi:hypothetical protein